MSYNKLEMN